MFTPIHWGFFVAGRSVDVAGASQRPIGNNRKTKPSAMTRCELSQIHGFSRGGEGKEPDAILESLRMIIPLFHYSNLLYSNLPSFQYSNALLAYLLLPFKNE